MKIFVLGFALLAIGCAVAEILPSNEYLPPVQDIDGPLTSGGLADDGYRYKTVRRFRVRRRRDVNELPSAEYLPPVQQVSSSQLGLSQVGLSQIAPSNEYLAPLAPTAPIAQISSGVLADDGYRYKTVRRFRTRHRRDVNEFPSAEYLPPAEHAGLSQIAPSNEYLAPLASSAPIAQISSGALADDGYRYKTVRRLRTRHRRDVNELPSAEYLPPAEHAGLSQIAPSNEYLAPIAQISSGVLADDGYRYKTVRRFRTRHRRDVNELPSAEYLPPAEHAGLSQIAPSNEYLAPIAQISSGVLADDGYRYKTVRRFRTRHRRNVNELPSAEYLPPAEHAGLSQIAPSNEYLAPLAPSAPIAQISSGVLADDGYRYKTVRRFRTRHRRNVNELPSAEYLPPAEHAGLSQIAPSNEYLAPLASAAPIAQISSGVLADDGYRYKTVRRLRTRHRRDVSELPSAEYLPPVQQIGLSQISPIVPSSQYLSPIDVAPLSSNILSGVLADDGYRYKTVKKIKRRH